MTIKVIQWAPGTVGSHCLEEMILHPDLDLVGVFVYSESKRGKDAGELVGLPPTGVVATSDIDEILALDADVVVHCPRLDPDLESIDRDVIRLLESGKNVISSYGYFNPVSLGTEFAQRLDNACQKGRVSLMGNGLNPGFLLERLTLLLTSTCMRVDSIDLLEYFNAADDHSEDMMVTTLGFGQPADSFNPSGPIASAMSMLYSQAMQQVADRIGVVFDRTETDHSMVVAEQDEQIAATMIKKGTIAGLRWRWINFVDQKPFLTFTLQWIAVRHLKGEWGDADHWRIAINGRPGVTCDVRLIPDRGDTHLDAAARATAAYIMRSIPELLSAPVGLLQPRAPGAYSADYQLH